MKHLAVGLPFTAGLLATGCCVSPSLETIPRGAPMVLAQVPIEPAQAERLAATAEEIRLIRASRLTEDARLREAHNARAAAFCQRVRACGGYEGYLQSLLDAGEEARPNVPPGADEWRPPGLQFLGDELARVRCVGPEVSFVLGFGDAFEVEPERDILVTGCTFGERPGEVRLVYPQHGGIHFPFEILDWEKNLIRARLPARGGTPDHDAFLQVVLNQGERSKLVPVRFRATRDYEPVFGGYLNVARSGSAIFEFFSVGQTVCAPDPPDDLATKRRVSVSYEAYHSQRDVGSAMGTDTWWLDLENGWVLESVTLWQEVTRDGQYNTALAAGPKGFVLGSPHIEFQVDWRVNGQHDRVYYHGIILVSGPVGLPYASDLNPGLVVDFPESLPGALCSMP